MSATLKRATSSIVPLKYPVAELWPIDSGSVLLVIVWFATVPVTSMPCRATEYDTADDHRDRRGRELRRTLPQPLRTMLHRCRETRQPTLESNV